MFIIRKITQRYHIEQDRICMSVQNEDGQVLLLWLTQRLANRLAGALVAWLDNDLKAVAIGQFVSNLHALEQAVAQAQSTSCQPVDPAVARSEALLSIVDLARDQHDGYTLTFKWAAESARLTLSVTELRQWLGILHRLFDTAEWPKHVWPEWFAAGGIPSVFSHLLH
jgi:hypothetical protein